MQQEQSSTNHEERGHHPDSASGLQPAEWCESYRPTSGDSEASLRGTACHKACETRNFDDLSDEETSAVHQCLDFVDELMLQRKAEQGTYPTLIKESYLPIDDEKSLSPSDWKGTTGGFNDVALVSKDETEADILDYKFVRWEVEDAENNIQGITYMLGLRHRFPKLQKVRIWFLMPYLKKISFAEFTADQFPGLYLRVKRLVHRRYAEDRTETPSWGTCMFCSRIASCKALARDLVVLGKKFAPLQWPADVTPTTLADGTADARARMQCADVAQVWGKATRASVTDKVVSGTIECPDGYTVANQSDREVAKPEEFIKRVAAAIDVKTDVVWAATTPSIGAIEKLVKSHAPRGMKGEIAEQLLDTCEEEEILTRGQPKIFLRAKKEHAED